MSKPKIYYAHPIELYFSEIEAKDLKFLSRKGIITNPRSIKFQNMIDYIYLVKDHEMVYYRGKTWGVAFEVLSALTFEIPVYSLDINRKITKKQCKEIIGIFKSSPYYEDDIKSFKTEFPEFYDRFLKILTSHCSHK